MDRPVQDAPSSWRNSVFSQHRRGRRSPSIVAGDSSESGKPREIALEQMDYIADVDYDGRINDFLATSPKTLATTRYHEWFSNLHIKQQFANLFWVRQVAPSDKIMSLTTI